MPCLVRVTLELASCAVNISPSYGSGSGSGREHKTLEIFPIRVTLFQKSNTPLAGVPCIIKLSCGPSIVIPIAVVKSVAFAIFWLTQDCLKTSRDGVL